MTGPAAPHSSRRSGVAFLLVFVAPWLVYALILAVQPVDALVAWRGDVAWPGEHYLTVSQGGLWLPAFGHLMFAGIGGVMLAMVLGGLVRLACHLLGARDRSGPIFPLILILVQPLCFAFFKAVPETVTTIDVTDHRLEVQRFGTFLRLPAEHITITGDQLLALEIDSDWYRRNGTRNLNLYALTRDRERVLIGMRPCDAGDEHDPSPCLTAADPELRTLAAWLGLGERPVDTTTWPGRHLVLAP